MTTYIKNNISGHFLTLSEPLDEKLYNIGSSLEDYTKGKWVPLSDEQSAFKTEHPSANVTEVWNMKLFAIPERTIEQAIREKRDEIDRYDQSEEVNIFSINGYEMWLDKATRVGLANSIDKEEAAGRTETTLWFEDLCFNLPISIAKDMLLAVELYALACYNTTASHKAAVSRLITIEEVDSYNYKTGYPEKLTLNIGEA